VPKALAATLAAGLIAIVGVTQAATPNYKITNVYVPPDQYALGGNEAGLQPRPIYKPHDSRTSFTPVFWVTSNERTGCAGVTTLENFHNTTMKQVIIDEPGVEFHGDETTDAPPCVGSIVAPPPGGEPPEGTPPGPDDQFPPDERFHPSVCLPVVLPPGQTDVTYDVEAPGGGRATGTVKSAGNDALGRARVCAPLGTERHARHPHGITVDFSRNRAYQVIEHAGLRWNADRTRIEIANTTDEESGFTLAWDVSNPNNPTVVNGYINGHGAHEITVNQRNGLVFQGNHEDSPGVSPSIWVDVIDTTKANPYGFIDTGYFQAIQGIDVDESRNVVWGTSHVGELVFAFNGNCVPTANPPGVVPPPAPPGYSLPPGDTNMKMGWNCIKWWVPIRPAFLAKFPELANIFDPDPTVPGALPLVLHTHNLVADDVGHRSYASIHSIHDAEHTGLSDEEPPPGGAEEEGAHHYMARYVVEVRTPTSVNAKTKKGTAGVSIIDLSHGYGILQYPNAEEVQNAVGLSGLMKSFVHAHFLWVDPSRNALLVSGEHTGNLGVVNTVTRQLKQVIPISKPIFGCTPPPPEPGQPPEVEEPHVHGVYIQPTSGTVYVMDEGEHCFYESATTLRPQ